MNKGEMILLQRMSDFYFRIRSRCDDIYF